MINAAISDLKTIDYNHLKNNLKVMFHSKTFEYFCLFNIIPYFVYDNIFKNHANVQVYTKVIHQPITKIQFTVCR